MQQEVQAGESGEAKLPHSAMECVMAGSSGSMDQQASGPSSHSFQSGDTGTSGAIKRPATSPPRTTKAKVVKLEKTNILTSESDSFQNLITIIHQASNEGLQFSQETTVDRVSASTLSDMYEQIQSSNTQHTFSNIPSRVLIYEQLAGTPSPQFSAEPDSFSGQSSSGNSSESSTSKLRESLHQRGLPCSSSDRDMSPTREPKDVFHANNFPSSSSDSSESQRRTRKSEDDAQRGDLSGSSSDSDNPSRRKPKKPTWRGDSSGSSAGRTNSIESSISKLEVSTQQGGSSGSSSDIDRSLKRKFITIVKISSLSDSSESPRRKSEGDDIWYFSGGSSGDEDFLI